jgi:hypothetical protein
MLVGTGPELFEFPFTEAPLLQTAIEDLRAALLALVDRHGESLDGLQGNFSGAAREAFDRLLDLAVADIESLAAHLNGQAMTLATTIQAAAVEAAEREAEIEAWLADQRAAVAGLPPPAGQGGQGQWSPPP